MSPRMGSQRLLDQARKFILLLVCFTKYIPYSYFWYFFSDPLIFYSSEVISISSDWALRTVNYKSSISDWQ